MQIWVAFRVLHRLSNFGVSHWRAAKAFTASIIFVQYQITAATDPRTANHISLDSLQLWLVSLRADMIPTSCRCDTDNINSGYVSVLQNGFNFASDNSTAVLLHHRSCYVRKRKG
jgi:hypothetical protein